jgi:hypothetical protein
MRRQNHYQHFVLNEIDDTCRIVGDTEAGHTPCLSKSSDGLLVDHQRMQTGF